MDYSIISVIKKDDLIKIGVVEKLFCWGDEAVSDSPKRFYSEENVQLIEMWSDVELENYIALRIVGGLRELEFQANSSKELFDDNNIMNFLEKVCCLESFNIIIKEDDANVEKNIEYNRNSNFGIYDIVADALNWDKPKNIKIYR